MLYVSGLLLLLLDLSVICGQTTEKNGTTFEEQILRTEDPEQKLNRSFITETLNDTFENWDGQSFPFGHCLENHLKFNAEHDCWVTFNDSMRKIDEMNWCNMEMVVRSYHKLTVCMEEFSYVFNCFYPNHVVESLYVRIHQEYFSSCSSEEEPSDAPAEVVLVATLVPILLIPFIVYIVVWKSSLKD